MEPCKLHKIYTVQVSSLKRDAFPVITRSYWEIEKRPLNLYYHTGKHTCKQNTHRLCLRSDNYDKMRCIYTYLRFMNMICTSKAEHFLLPVTNFSPVVRSCIQHVTFTRVTQTQ